ncbi:MAG: proline--tRNA ligase, partial [Candidatus Baumannia cicadellinicola]|nr:proline--tRNA ligase [Candidatus Baumannia cicadellinicola]
YTWLPTGLRILRKVENIVREEMNNIGAIEVSMPIVQPANLWLESGRWGQYGPELLRFTDRSTRQFLLGPTHEEVITDLIRNEVKSYKQLPLNLFQIKTKFRDEVRPRYGVMRSREFIMKDAYSFHTSQQSLQATYDLMYYTYNTIFNRIGLDVRTVQADPGSIGGHLSHEFLALVSNYEDQMLLIDASHKATERNLPSENLQLVDAPGIYTLTELVKLFNLPIEKIAQIIIVHAQQNALYPLVALMVRGDHSINYAQVEKLPQVASPLVFATEDEIRLAIGVGSSSLGPINLPLPLIIDHSVAVMSDFVAGANIDGKYFFGINWERDLSLPEVANLTNQNISVSQPQRLHRTNWIEVGHIFQLGSKYSKVMKATVQGEDGNNMIMTMGCYGIGITRVVAAAIDKYNDKQGLLLPVSIAPFQVAIIPINLHKSLLVQTVAEQLYNQLSIRKIDVLLDDRKERPGVMFADIELIGIPHIIIIGDRNLAVQKIEYKNRSNGEKKLMNLSIIVDWIVAKLNS